MSAPGASAPGNTPAIVGAIATIATMGIGLSLSIPLLSLRMEAAGYSARAIGLQTAMGAIATFAGAPFVPALVRRLGVRRFLVISILTGIFCLIGFGLIQDISWWYPLRLIYGAAITAIFVTGEYAINALAPENRRGFVMGVYGTALALGFAAGPAVLSLTGVEGITPFLAGAVLFGLAAVPALLAGGAAPPMGAERRGGAFAFLFKSPSATIAALAFGAVETGVMGLLPVYALHSGASAVQGAQLLGACMLGSVFFSFPLGLLSDRMDRRKLLLIIGLIGLAGAGLMPLLARNFASFAALLFVWGGIVGALYPVGLAHLGSRHRGADLASANAAFVMLYSLGMLVAPPLLGTGLDVWDPHGFAAGLALLFALYAALVALRLRRTAR